VETFACRDRRERGLGPGGLHDARPRSWELSADVDIDALLHAPDQPASAT
jgi:hypothetical protein